MFLGISYIQNVHYIIHYIFIIYWLRLILRYYSCVTLLLWILYDFFFIFYLIYFFFVSSKLKLHNINFKLEYILEGSFTHSVMLSVGSLRDFLTFANKRTNSKGSTKSFLHLRNKWTIPKGELMDNGRKIFWVKFQIYSQPLVSVMMCFSYDNLLFASRIVSKVIITSYKYFICFSNFIASFNRV